MASNSSAGEAYTRAVVRERSGGVCEAALEGYCYGAAENISHRRARSAGGLWTPENCMDACGSGTTGCHGWIEHHWVAAEALGLRVRSSHDPALKPVMMRTAEWPKAWYLLRPDGTLTPCYD